MKTQFFGTYDFPKIERILNKAQHLNHLHNSRARLTSAVEVMVLHLNGKVKHENATEHFNLHSSFITIIKLDSFHIASVF